MGRNQAQNRVSTRWQLLAACGFLSLGVSAAIADAPASQPAATSDKVAPPVSGGKEPTPISAPPSATPAVAPVATGYAPVIVEAERREQSVQDVPASVTTLDSRFIQDAQITNVKSASQYVPNLFVSQFSAPRVSNPFIRGIGSGQNSPGIATYIDGVPQLSYSTSNIELVDVDRFEFVRGSQSTLYGRSALGGVINIFSQQPDNKFEGDLNVTGGTYNLQDYRGGIRGPIVQDKAYFAIAGGFLSRDGYTKNFFTGNDLDNRDDYFGRVEFRFTPNDNWDLRITANGEHDRDGDFPISDIAAMRRDPWRVNHDYTGEAHRDVSQVAFTAIYHGQDVDFTSVTAFQYWREKELTDLDESIFNGAQRSNQEHQSNYIEELRVFSPTGRPINISEDVKFSYLAGALFFASNDHQLINNQIESPFLTGGLPVPLDNFQDAKINTYGIGVYAQGTLTFWDKLDVTGGARVDYEYSSSHLGNFSNSAFVPTAFSEPTRNDTQVSPQFSVDYHVTKDVMPYVSATRGFRPGGFNPVAPSASQNSYGVEQTWSYEGGVKTSWFDNHLVLNADVFYIDWKHQQLNVAIPNTQSEFFIDNVGRSHSTGFEAEGILRPCKYLDMFAGIGFTDARFDRYVQTNGQSAHGNRLPNAPETTWNVGAQLGFELGHGLRTYVRGEVIGVGPMAYDSTNALEQGAYMITNFRVGVAADKWRLEGFVNNAFNTHYFPVSFPFGGTQSGYVGQEGDPLTMGVTLGLTF